MNWWPLVRDLIGPGAKELWKYSRGPVLGVLVLANVAIWCLYLWPISVSTTDETAIISASAEYDYKDKDGRTHHFKGEIPVKRVDLSGVTPEPTVEPEPDRPCRHLWVNGPYFVMMAGIPWDFEKPSSITRIQHCTNCGLMRLNKGQREMNRGSLIEGSSIIENEMLERIERREVESRR